MSKGVESIRIKGQEIQDLPLGMGNEAKAQLPEAIETERLNSIATINANFPKHRIDYLVSRIKECTENKERMDKTIMEQNTMISEYKGHIRMSKYRDTELVKIQRTFDSGRLTEDELKMMKKALFKQFPPYVVTALEQQIVQCGEAIVRCNNVKNLEDASILEFTEVVAQCKQRDKELKQFGAVAEGS